MNRRETIKSLIASSIASSLLLTTGCDKTSNAAVESDVGIQPNLDYGRTEEEKKKDLDLLKNKFLTPHEIETLVDLADIILPANESFNSANSVGFSEFIEFIVKDIPDHQIPIRGGLMWLDSETKKTFKNNFIDCSKNQKIALCNKIAFPGKTPVELQQGEAFFTLIRNLVITSYYTTEEGFRDLGYKGNTPNVWDGVPQDVLDDHGLSYEKEWLEKCLNTDTRNVKAEWDKNGNLIT